VAHFNGNYKRSITAVMAEQGPFTVRDLADRLHVPPSTMGSIVSALTRVRFVAIGAINPEGRHVYRVIRQATYAEATHAIAQHRATSAARHKRKHTKRRAPATDIPIAAWRRRQTTAQNGTGGTSLLALREALDKAVLYDKLLVYLNLTHAEVLAALPGA
jgi:predicted transcriptional regulator